MEFVSKKYADDAIEDIVIGTHDCDVTRTMIAMSIISSNAEAAFYEKQIDEDEIQEYKDIVDEHIHKFRKNCLCNKK